MAPPSRWSDVKVGLFVIVAIAILVIGSLWIAGDRIFAGASVQYDVLLKDSGGVVAGDRVRVAGIAMGRIQAVTLRPDEEWPVVMRVSVKAPLTVHEDATAAISTSGVLGTSFLEIEPGSAGAPQLPPGGQILGHATSGMDEAFEQVGIISKRVLGILDQTSALLDQVSSEVTPLLDRLQTLASEENSENLAAILASARATLDDVAPRVGPLIERLDALASTMEGSMEGVPALTEQASSLLNDLHAALGPDGQRLSQLLDGASATVGSADEAVQVLLDNRASIESSLRDLETTMANLKAFSDRVKQQPSSLLRSTPQRERRPGDAMPSDSRGGRR